MDIQLKPTKLLRIEDRSDYSGHAAILVHIYYHVIRETDQGVWIDLGSAWSPDGWHRKLKRVGDTYKEGPIREYTSVPAEEKKFVLLGKGKRFAHATMEDALHAHFCRKARCLLLLQKQVNYQKKAMDQSELKLRQSREAEQRMRDELSGKKSFLTKTLQSKLQGTSLVNTQVGPLFNTTF